MVTIENRLASGLESIDKKPDVDVPEETVARIQEWVRTREFDEEDMVDTHRTKEFDEFVVVREHFHGHEDTVTIQTEDVLATQHLSDFLAIEV